MRGARAPEEALAHDEESNQTPPRSVYHDIPEVPMLLFALFACTPEEKPPADEPTAPDDTASGDTADTADTADTGPDDTGPDDTGPDTDPADTWTPETFFFMGEFAYDPDTDSFIGWSYAGEPTEAHIDFHFFSATGWTCKATAYFTPADLALETWRFEDTIVVDGVELDAMMEHTGWSARPARVESGCGALDPAVWGADTVEALIGARAWGLGYGQIRADVAYNGTDVSFGGSYFSDILASGTPPVDAPGTASVAHLDADGNVVLDEQSRPVLMTFDTVQAAGSPRGLYYVDGGLYLDAQLLAF